VQRKEIIEFRRIKEIIASIFEEPAVAYQDYSDFDSELQKYDSNLQLLDAVNQAVSLDRHSANFAIYYPQAKGFIFEERKTLNPDKCDGATYRYVLNGWGLVMLQVDFRQMPTVEVNVSVNSEKRAVTWSHTHPEFKDPASWDWKYIEKQARRTIRVLRKCAS